MLDLMPEPAYTLKTSVQICESQDSYRVKFHACASYLMMMVQKSLAAKQVNVAATTTEVDGVKLKNKDGTNRCLPPAKYFGSVYKMLSSKQKETLWQDCKKGKANEEDIPAAKKRCSQPSPKPAKNLESAMATQKRQISSLTAQNEKMITSLIASSIKIPESGLSSGEDDDGDHKMVANQNNSNPTKTNKRRK